MSEKLKGHVLLLNVSKPKNMGTIVRYLSYYRSAAAFNFDTIFTVIKDDSKKEFRYKDIQKRMGLFGN